MIADLKPYPAYKDSGVEWLGQVPEYWEVLPNRALFDEIKDRNHSGEEMLSVTIKHGVIRQASLLEESSKKDSSNLDRSNYKLVQPKDLAYNKMRAWQGALGVSSFRGIVSPAYVVQRPKSGVNSEYFHHLFRLPAFAKEAERWSYGITSDMWSLRPEHFKLIYSCLPPLAEQAAIVRYLNHVDRKVKRFVRAKRKLIALLEEQKRAIIHQAVTRGLDPNVPMKDSGVEWLGEVPEGWEVKRLKSLVYRIDQGISPQAENCLADDGSWGVVKAGCVNRGVFRESQHKRLPSGFPIDTSLAITVGDILVSRASGSPHLVGSVGRVSSLNYRLILSDKIFRPVLRPNIDPEFLVLVMNCQYYRLQVDQAISGAEGLANNLPLSSLRVFFFAIPSFSEQQKIVEGTRRSIDQLHATITRTQREISLIEEYRTRLISDVVTGKLDVREAAAGLPEEVEGEEPEEIETDEGGEVEEETDQLLEEDV